MNEFFLILALLSVLWGIVSAMVITGTMSHRGIAINVPLFRLYVLKYIHQYYVTTRQERGHAGPWFYSFVVSMNLALVLVVVGLLVG